MAVSTKTVWGEQGKPRELLENEVKPMVQEFLEKRGLIGRENTPHVLVKGSEIHQQQSHN